MWYAIPHKEKSMEKRYKDTPFGPMLIEETPEEQKERKMKEDYRRGFVAAYVEAIKKIMPEDYTVREKKPPKETIIQLYHFDELAIEDEPKEVMKYVMNLDETTHCKSSPYG